MVMLMEKYWKQMFIFGAIAVSAVDRIGGFKKIVSTKFIQFIKMFLKVTVCVLGLFISAALSGERTEAVIGQSTSNSVKVIESK